MLTTPRKKPVAICTADTPQAHACTCALIADACHISPTENQPAKRLPRRAKLNNKAADL